jgi:hypothetical protein
VSDLTSFDPGKYLTKVGGADYLEVKWRLVWLRQRHPDASIETEMIAHAGDAAIFKAMVSIPGGGSATGWGSESVNDFRDYIEKAETKALGRALAALGFGTQFCPDFEFGANGSATGLRVVDTPVDFASTRGRRLAAQQGQSLPRPQGEDLNRPAAQADQTVTPRQLKFIQAIAREAGIDEEALRDEVERTYGRPVAELGRRDASAFIERLQARRGAVADLAS